MKIKIPNKVADLLKTQLKAENIVNPDEFRFRDDFEIDLTGRSVEQLNRIQQYLEPYTKIRGTRAAVRDVGAWLALQKGEALPKCRSCKDAAGILKAYIMRSERKHVYRTTSGAAGEEVLPYHVNNIQYHPPRGEDNPAYLEMDLRYIDCGELHRYSLAWYTGDVQSQTPAELLAAKGFTLESTILRDDYEYHLDRYKGIVHAVGDQYLGTGDAQTLGRSYWRESVRLEDDEGRPSKLVVDVIDEEEGGSRSSRESKVNGDFWLTSEQKQAMKDEDSESPVPQYIPDIPTHPFCVLFHLKKHQRVRVHVQNLEKYVYDTSRRNQLVLPKRDEALLDVLLADTKATFQDVIADKTGGVVILCQGSPGTGKTLTAEVYAEALERPLYNVQCSQLGLTPKALEEELLTVFTRASRWGAVMLLDEADVYIHERGSDLVHNAIVGVFLRVLEYYDGVLFMTTNRGDTVDDAVLSRCTARINYGVPPLEDQIRIWRLLAKANGIEIDDPTLAAITIRHQNLSGRDIKNLVKLCLMVNRHTGRKIDVDLVTEMSQFKPTMVSVGDR